MKIAANLVGLRVGRLVVVKHSHFDRSRGSQVWECQCDCGAKCFVTGRLLHNKIRPKKSCGCISRGGGNLKPRLTSKGLSDAFPAEYRSWTGMRDRCTRKSRHNYARYGGRGITVSSRWDSFAYFIWDLGPKPSQSHSLDRINNDGNYEPNNCRWALPEEQAANRSVTRRRG